MWMTRTGVAAHLPLQQTSRFEASDRTGRPPPRKEANLAATWPSETPLLMGFIPFNPCRCPRRSRPRTQAARILSLHPVRHPLPLLTPSMVTANIRFLRYHISRHSNHRIVASLPHARVSMTPHTTSSVLPITTPSTLVAAELIPALKHPARRPMGIGGAWMSKWQMRVLRRLVVGSPP